MSENQLASAQAAIQRGEIAQARKIVAKVLMADPVNEQAWLLMARLASTREQVIDCLKRARRINPNNRATIAALKAITRSLPSKEVAPSPTQSVRAAPVVVTSHPPTVIQTQTKERKFIKLSFAEEAETIYRPPKRRINWSLLIGSFIVAIVIAIALVGPLLAPQDPMAEHSIVQVGNTWEIPPFNAFQVPGYPLGSDQFGRDMLSRILFAVRPTLIMVSIVAITRLILGTIIGLGAGWSNGRLGHALDTAISAALSIPILLIALGTITVIGTSNGLIPFIIGLSINGWGETARFVREQTQLVKGQLYIESARSLGSSTFQILVKHILRQLMPMVWMLFAFEISGTLMVTAGLGFLGYYIGGDVWVVVEDFVSRRISGAPELGQMLATSWVNLLQPWPLVLTGSVIFITVLGFNLMGNGLRSRLKPEFINRSSFIALLRQRLSLFIEENVSYPVSNWFRGNRLRPILVTGLVLGLVGSIYFYQVNASKRFNPSLAALTIPGGEIWAANRIDPYGTNYLNSIGPAQSDELWLYHHEGGYSGNPVISADGTIYVAGQNGLLMAFNPDGSQRWQMTLPELPLGSLALGPQGDIYATDSKGGLSAISIDGNLLWTYTTDVFGKPNHGSIVAPNGTVYYLLETATGDTLNAVLPNGQLLWSVKPGTRGADAGLRLTADGKQLLVKNTVVNTSDGSVVDLTLPTADNRVYADKAVLFVGADGKTYLLAGHVVMQWKQTSQGFTMVQSANWNYRSSGFSQYSSLPVDSGVDARGNIWLYYSNIYEGTYIYWLDPTGNILGNFYEPFNRETHLIGIDGADTAYACGLGQDPSLDAYSGLCQANSPAGDTPLWTYTLPEGNFVITGAALAPGRLYLLTEEGNLIALGDASAPSSSITATPSP
jgi:peptide/nickel transport system permease protein